MTVALPFWKKLMLAAYLQGTLPKRRRANRRAERLGNAPIMILFYHRVADQTPNDWTISSRQFRRQIRWLRANFDLVSLREARQRIRRGSNYRTAVSVTFDDGYAENCENALPLLIGEGIPVTYFVSTRHVLAGQPFPHDLDRGRPLAPNSLEQLRALSEAGVEIGVHARTHADLGKTTDRRQLMDEVIGARDDLQQALGQPARYFAFPYGRHENLNAEAFRLARDAGYEAVCSAYGGYNFPGDDGFHLQRIHADTDFTRFTNWLTVDPRKVNSVRRYEYAT